MPALCSRWRNCGKPTFQIQVGRMVIHRAVQKRKRKRHQVTQTQMRTNPRRGPQSQLKQTPAKNRERWTEQAVHRELLPTTKRKLHQMLRTRFPSNFRNRATRQVVQNRARMTQSWGKTLPVGRRKAGKRKPRTSLQHALQIRRQRKLPKTGTCLATPKDIQRGTVRMNGPLQVFTKALPMAVVTRVVQNRSLRALKYHGKSSRLMEWTDPRRTLP
mmetsp:Transcript_7966/g.23998  ORF Transcript_7966/g.23998 Transcript_7966/m.23998 type:complete len:216 (+) Transcript_7966:1254-1901(+)